MLIPQELRSSVEAVWQRFLAACREQLAPEALKKLQQLDALHKSVMRVFCASKYVSESCTHDSAMLVDLFISGDIQRSYTEGEYLDKLRVLLAGDLDEASLGRVLRCFRRREMVRIIWRDLMAWAPLEEVLANLSNLADACITETLQRLYAQHCEKYGTPYDNQDRQQYMIVLALGKLGGQELNLSSDVDLIFVYPQQGGTRGKERALSNEEFFIQLGQALIKVLNTITAEGFVFRVDMRLRPFGDSGPLAMSIRSMSEYYQQQGRDWERYAFIKARKITGEGRQSVELLRMLRAFTYRRYIDFGAIEAIRAIKQQIDSEARAKGMRNNIKVGVGGIREIEFVAQVFQLIRGGQDRRLRQSNLLKVLTVLGETNYLPAEVPEELTKAYKFLRKVENRLQAVADRQTQVLPKTPDGKTRLAFSMGYKSWTEFYADLSQHQENVKRHFDNMVAKSKSQYGKEDDTQVHSRFLNIWIKGKDPSGFLEKVGFEPVQEVLQLLDTFKQSYRCRRLRASARDRLDLLMPQLLRVVAQTREPNLTLKRIIDVLDAIVLRSAYVSLLLENGKALEELATLCAASPWIAHQLARYPVLLDELLDSRILFAPQNKSSLQSELERQFSIRPEDEALSPEENAMECLRKFKHAQVLRVAAADITERLPLMKVSDHLTDIATVILARAQRIAWQEMVSRYGYPEGCDKDGGLSQFAIVAYGKLGGIELGYGSDLDLVFLRTDMQTDQHTDGEQSISNAAFFIRLGQRIIHILSTRTFTGELYQVDMRLRPSGDAGLLVSSINAFADYQKNNAWAWEHQALVRARMLTGDEKLHNQFLTIRREVLAIKREDRTLREGIASMRQKMRSAVRRAPQGFYDLKQGVGGMTDIEFIVQYGVLAWAHRNPALLTYTDNIRILEGFAAVELLSEKDAQGLIDAYKTFRALVHRRDLAREPAYIIKDEVKEECQHVANMWQHLIVDGAEGLAIA